MKRVVHTGLPEFGRATEHAVMADGHLSTTAVPLKTDGTFDAGDARSQIALALENLEKTVLSGLAMTWKWCSFREEQQLVPDRWEGLGHKLHNCCPHCRCYPAKSLSTLLG